MKVKRYVLVSAAVLAAGAGGGAAIAATSGGDERQKTEASILDDAAKRLNVTPEALKSALGAAEDAQLDQQVKNGKLTQEQADAIKKARAQSGTVLGGPGVHGPGGPGFRVGPGRPGGPGRGGFGLGLGGLRFHTGAGGALDAAATALGLKRDELLAKLRAGQSIADVAKAQSKSLDDVKAAITAAVTQELDARVKDGKLTADQRDKVLSELKDHLDDLVTLKPPTPPKGAPALPFGHP
jgi:polyhydroxyalkanoate synthesis regulator phasin